MILSLAPGSTGASTAAWALGLPSLTALVAYGFAALARESQAGRSQTALLVGWIAQALAIGADIAGIGSDIVAARFGFAPALSMTVWLVLAVTLVESRFVPLPNARRVLALLGIAVVVIAWAFPGEVRAQVASRWAPVHWALGLASYGLFGAAVLHAALLSRAERRMRPAVVASAVAASQPVRGMPLLQLERMTFRFVGAGFVALSAAILLGFAFAGPWRWDHKTVFSLLAWLVFAGLLAGRIAFGWRGPVATRGVYAGAVLLLFAYVGSRFVLEVVLHRMPA